jgi:hypothetical protein
VTIRPAEELAEVSAAPAADGSGAEAIDGSAAVSLGVARALVDEPLPHQQVAIEAPAPPHTSDLAVDEAVVLLARSMAEPLEEQVAVYDAVHRTLQDRLADVEG